MMDEVDPDRRYVYGTEFKEYTGGGARFCDGDTLFARITPSLENGKIAQFRGQKIIPAFGSTEFIVLRAREGISDPGFLYYLAKTETVRKPAEKSMFGASGRQRADVNVVREIMVPSPPLPTQRKIAAILSAYDDLIENNTQRIKILEEMAQTLYRHWFVDFKFPGHEDVRLVDSGTELGLMPEGWAIVSLNQIAVVTYGYGFKSNLFTTDVTKYPVIRIRDILKNSTETYTTEIPEGKYLVEDGDILVGMDGDFHMCRWASGLAYLNQRVARFRPVGNLSKYVLFMLLKGPIEFFNSTITGTTVAHLGDRHLQTIKVMIPNESILERLNNIFNSFHEQEIVLRRKNANLRQTRELLLPKLVSGELDITDLDVAEISSI